MTIGLVKPNGLPTFQGGNPLAADMLFYGVDLGNGTIADVVAGGPTMVPADPLPPITSTGYGSGIGWNNQDSVLGDGYYANINSAVQNALNLANASPGAGFTFGSTFVELGSTGTQALIFGRPAHAAEAIPLWNEAFITVEGEPEVQLVLNNNGAAQVIGSYDFGSYGTIVSVICTVLNTGNGTGIAEFFAASGGSPGTLIGTATVTAESTSSFGLAPDGENQIMFGSVYHVQTGVNWNSFNGPVFSGFIAGTAWTNAEALTWLSNPYELLSWPAPLAAPSISSVTDDAGTLSNGAPTNDPDPTVQVSLSGTGALDGDTVQLYDGPGTSTPLGDSYTLTSTDIGNGFATVKTGLLTTGTTYNLMARLADQSGDQSAASATFTVIENTALPAVIWAGGVSGTWQTASDWTPAMVPGASNNVFILPSGTSTVTDSQTTTVDSVVTDAGATLAITGGTFTITNGTGADANAGTVAVEGLAALDILPGTLTNAGTLEAAGGGMLDLAGTSVANSDGTVTVASGSTLDVNDATITAGLLTNAGAVDVMGGNTSTFSGVNVNSTGGTGTVTNTLALDGDGFSSRPFVSTTSTSVALTTTKVNDVVILDIVQNGTTVSSVTDAADLTWHERAVAGSGSDTIYEYYAIASNTLSADAITVNFTGTASYADLNAFGISGANTSSPFDTSVAATPASSTGAVTISNADDFVFASYRFASNATPSAGSSWTAINASGGYYVSEYQITSATQTGMVATASTTDENGGIVDAVVQAPTSAAAALTVASGSTLDLNDTTMTGGTLTNSGTVDQTGGTSSLTGVAITNSETIEATSGTLTASGPVTNTGNFLANGGNLDFTGDVTGNGTAMLSGTNSILEFEAASAENTTFAGTDDILKLDNVSSFTGTVAGLVEGDGIDLTNFLFANNPTVTGVIGTGVTGSTTNVTVQDGALRATLELLNQYTNQFAVTPTTYSLVADNNTPNHGTTLQLANAHT